MSATILPQIALSTLPPPSVWPIGRVFGETSFRTDADVLAVSFGPGGLWSVEEGGGLRQWDEATGRLVNWRELEEDATLWSFRPDGRLLAGAAADLTLWDVATGRRRLVIPDSTCVP